MHRIVLIIIISSISITVIIINNNIIIIVVVVIIMIIVIMMFIHGEYGLPCPLEREPPNMLGWHGGGTCRRQLDMFLRFI